MGVALPQKPPALKEILRSTAAQGRLLQLLQGVLIAAERLPSDGSWRHDSAKLVGAASLLVQALQREAGGGGPNRLVPADGPPSSSAAAFGLATLANRAMGALGHAGRAVDEASSCLSEVLSRATTEVRQRAWAGAARPEPYRVRTFVRLKQPSTFELFRDRLRSKRIEWGTTHASVRPSSASPRPSAPPLRVELNEVIEPSASQQRTYAAVVEPLVKGVLCGLDCALLCIGASASGKTYTLHGTESAREDPLNAPRSDWGAAMRACEQLLQEQLAAPRSLTHANLAAAAAGGAAVHATFVEVGDRECYDLLGGGGRLRIEQPPGPSGVAELVGAATVRVGSMEDAAQMLRTGLRALRSRGVLAPKTHTVLTLAVHHREGGEGGGEGGGGGGGGEGGSGEGGGGGEGGD